MVYYRWLEKWKRDRRKGYRKFLYPNETTVSKSSPVDKDKVTMYAQWEGIQYTVLYDGKVWWDWKNGKPDGNVWNSNAVE